MASEVLDMEYMDRRLSMVEEMSFTTRRGERLGISGIEMTERTLLREVRSESTLPLLVAENVVEIWEASLADEVVEMVRSWV